jgi:hypothetical protein
MGASGSGKVVKELESRGLRPPAAHARPLDHSRALVTFPEMKFKHSPTFCFVRSFTYPRSLASWK